MAAHVWQFWEIRFSDDHWYLHPFCQNGTEERYSHPLPSPILPPSFLLQGSRTPLMVATLHPPSAGIAPQYSLPLGLGAGQPTLLEHTATVLVKQR